MRSLLLAVLGTLAAADLPVPPPLQPNPMEGTVTALRAFAASAGPLTPSGLRRSDLLSTIAGIVEWFLPHQNASTGAIIDPDTHAEEEYSTPCFAHAAATLVAHGARADLLSPATAALSCSISELARKDCATGHCDFFALPVMRAYDLLAPLVPAATAAAWESSLRSITPATWEFTGNNWELTAAAGEYTRIVKKQWGGGAENWTLWEARIGRLATVLGARGGFWSPEGMFYDNAMGGGAVTSPMAYDAFGSSYPAVMLNDGYNGTGVYASYLAATQERGVWTRAAYQSPLGEQPVGGRSNQHQFAEATLAAVAELYAVRARDAGDAVGACQLKRAAALYHSSVRRWRRADGAIQILKNWFLNSSERFGYMGYSYFSNYNTLPASWLALAYEFADDSIAECASPADVGGAAFSLDSPNMRKVYGSVAGTYVELQTGADPTFDASGFNRFHYDACALAPPAQRPCRLPGLLGPSQAPGISGNLGGARHGSAARPLTGAASAAQGGVGTGLVWALASDAPDAPRRSLANCSLHAITAAITSVLPTNSPATGVGWSTAYVLWEQGWLLTEQYFLPPSGGSVNVTASLAAPGARALFDAMARAAAASAQQLQQQSQQRTTYFSAPSDARQSQACAAGDFAAFVAAAPPHPAAAPLLRSVGVSFPAMVFDGSTNYTLRGGEGGVLLQGPLAPPPEEGALFFSVRAPAGRNLSWNWDAALTAPSRNGLLVPVYAELTPNSDAPVLQYSLEVVPWQA